MKESDPKVVVTCKSHTPNPPNESVMAIGNLDEKKGHLEINAYTRHFREREGRCIHCPYSKVYTIDNKGNVKERSGEGKTSIKKIKMRGEEMSYEKITEEARKLVPYL